MSHLFTAYQVLGLTREASDDDIERAWKTLRRAVHPDRKVRVSSEYVAQLDRAREVLLHDRAAHDAWIVEHEAPAPSVSMPPPSVEVPEYMPPPPVVPFVHAVPTSVDEAQDMIRGLVAHHGEAMVQRALGSLWSRFTNQD